MSKEKVVIEADTLLNYFFEVIKPEEIKKVLNRLFMEQKIITLQSLYCELEEFPAKYVVNGRHFKFQKNQMIKPYEYSATFIGKV